MHKALRPHGLRLAATASMLVLALNSTACSKVPGLAVGADPTGSPSDMTAAVQPASPSGVSNSLPSGIAATTPTASARTGTSQPVAAHRGAIAQTLSVVGKVAATEEVPLSFGERL